MSRSNVTPISILPEQKYLLHAYSTSAKVSLKAAKDAVPEAMLERYSNDCLIWHVNRTQKVFVFRFGAVVFFNIAPDEHQGYLARLGIVGRLHTPTPGIDELAEDDFVLQIEKGITQVQFNGVTIPEWDLAKLQLVAQLLAQSSALEIIEWEVEDLLARSGEMTSNLRKSGWVRNSREELLRFLGEGLTTRHRIVSQLSLLNDPEKTWEKEDLYKIYIGLWDNFDIDERIQAIEKNLQLCTEGAQLLLELANSRRAEILELIIIALITFEVIRPFFG